MTQDDLFDKITKAFDDIQRVKNYCKEMIESSGHIENSHEVILRLNYINRIILGDYKGTDDPHEIEPITPLPLPFDLNEKIFNMTDHDTGEIIGEPYSYNDFLHKIEDISGVNPELLGEN